MLLLKLADEFSVCKLSSTEGLDLTRPFTFLSITDDEISYVCPSEFVPKQALVIESGWKALKISGVLDFGLVGIIARISALLAEHKISLFVVSTYNTDYILLKSLDFEKSVGILRANQYEVE